VLIPPLPVAELVLHADHLDQPLRRIELGDGDVGEADHADLARALQVGDGPDRLLVRHRGVGPVVLVEVDRLHPQRAQAGLAGAPQVVGPAVDIPVAMRPDVAALGRDQHLVRRGAVIPQRAGDQSLVVARVGLIQAVRVGRVDQGHPASEDRREGRQGLILRGPPLHGEVHRAVAKHTNRPIPNAPLFHVSVHS